MIITNSRYALVGYFITSYPTRAHGIIVINSRSFLANQKARNAIVGAENLLKRRNPTKYHYARQPLFSEVLHGDEDVFGHQSTLETYYNRGGLGVV